MSQVRDCPNSARHFSVCLMQACVWSDRLQIKHALTHFAEQEPVFDKDIYFIYGSLLNKIKQTLSAKTRI